METNKFPSLEKVELNQEDSDLLMNRVVSLGVASSNQIGASSIVLESIYCTAPISPESTASCKFKVSESKQWQNISIDASNEIHQVLSKYETTFAIKDDAMEEYLLGALHLVSFNIHCYKAVVPEARAVCSIDRFMNEDDSVVVIKQSDFLDMF